MSALRSVGAAAAWLQGRGWSPGVVGAYVAVVGIFVWSFSQFYLPGKGFSYLIAFGAHLETSRLSKLRQLDYYVEKASDGYDAQHYVQIAMDPSLQNTQLAGAVDSLPYRARRILMPAVAHVAGLGQPAAILQAYALINAATWLALAAVLLHWFPPRDWGCFLRWAGVLGSFGICVSVRNALTDGPSLLLIALGLLLLERGRPWWATAAMAAGGLAKETNLLAAAALAPAVAREVRPWFGAAVRAAVVALPLALWLAYLAWQVGPPADPGARNFDFPLAAYLRKWGEVSASLPEASLAFPGPVWSLVMMVALTVQLVFLAVRPRWREAWWRVGASFGVLLLVLGDAVWEGYPGAASRVLLPMQLAFNVLVPAGRGWLAVLVLGNLTLLSAPSVLQPPLSDGLRLAARGELETAASGRSFQWEFSPGWYAPERGESGYWTWTAGTVTLTVRNPHDFPVRARLRFGLTAAQPRGFELQLNGTPQWGTALRPTQAFTASLGELVLQPGENRLVFATDVPAAPVPPDARKLAFCVHDLRLDIQAPAR